jgi:hypothetical protein
VFGFVIRPLLAAVLLSGPAGEARVGAGPPVFNDVPPAGRERIEAMWSDGLRDAGGDVVTSSDACAEQACLSELIGRDGATHAAGLEVTRSGRDYTLEITLIDAAGVTTIVDAECAICGFDEVAQVAYDKAVGLAPKLAAAQPGKLQITSNPEGARVLIDGEAVGTTPYTSNLPEGEYDVRVELDGYFPSTESVTVVGGGRDSLRVALERVPPSKPDRSRAKRIAGWSMVGVGIAALGGGAAFWAYHHSDVRGRCDDPANLDVNGTCRYRYDALAPALGLTITGVAALATGVTLVILGRKGGAEKTARRTPSVLPIIGPGSAGVSVSF